ncbi:MAG: CoA-binding protein [Oscillochloris sp.]|nr:CoA-binding protein [Oscillochloris sp.]
MTTTAPTSLNEKIADFLAQKRIAVAGISSSRPLPANLIYQKLKAAGYQVIAIHPTAGEFEGDQCYPNLAAVPVAIDGLVIATKPAITLDLVQQALTSGVPRIWMHESLMQAGTSVSPEAVELCRANNLCLIAGACPMMYCQPVDFGHRCMGWIMRVTGGLPN